MNHAAKAEDGFIGRNASADVVWGIPVIVAGLASIAVGVLYFTPFIGSFLFLLGLGVILIGVGATFEGGGGFVIYAGIFGTILLVAGLAVAYSVMSFPF